MASILLIINHPKESEILKLYFKSLSFKTLSMEASVVGFIKAIQYKPTIILVEIPQDYLEIVHFIKKVRRHKYTLAIPVIGYGNHTDKTSISGLMGKVIHAYLPRPLKTSKLLECIKDLVPKDALEIKEESSKKPEEIARITDSILDLKTPAGTKIDLMVKALGKLMAFPFTVAKVLSITQSDKTGAPDLAKAIEIDPVVSATILKISNSVLFASRNKQVSDVKEAIIRLGFTETKNITVSLSVIKSMSMDSKSFGFSRIEFWFNSLACAIICEKIAKNAGYPTPEEAFLAGLFINFGILMLDEFFEDIFSKLLEETTTSCCSFLEAEKKLMGFNSYDLSTLLFEEWKIPKNIIFSVKHFNDLQKMDENATPEEKVIAIAVHMAATIAKSIHFGQGCDMFVPLIDNDLIQRMKFEDGFQEQFFEEIAAQLNMYNSFLKVDNRKFAYAPSENKGALVTIIKPDLMLFNPVTEYLISMNYTITKETDIKTLLNTEKKPAFIFIHHADSFKPDETLPCFSIADKTEKDSHDSQKSPYIPVICFYEKEFDIPEGIDNKLVTSIKYPFDLRVLDFIMDSFSNGEPVDMSAAKVHVDTGETQESVNTDIRSEFSEADTGQADQGDTFEISIRELEHDIKVIDLKGSIQMKNIAELKKNLFEVLKKQYRHIAINFYHLQNIDSMLIGLLVNFHKQHNAIQGKLCFLNVRNAVRECFETASLDKVITFIDNEEELENYFATE